MVDISCESDDVNDCIPCSNHHDDGYLVSCRECYLCGAGISASICSSGYYTYLYNDDEVDVCCASSQSQW